MDDGLDHLRRRRHYVIALFMTFGFVCGCAGAGLGSLYGRYDEAKVVRGQIGRAYQVCLDITNMGLKDWQNATGMGLTYQVQCEPLLNVSEGREYHDDGE